MFDAGRHPGGTAVVVVADGTSRNQAPTKDLGRVPTLGLESQFCPPKLADLCATDIAS